MSPTLGRIVHYRIGGPDEAPILRAGLVVNPTGEDRCALRVELDPITDEATSAEFMTARAGAGDRSTYIQYEVPPAARPELRRQACRPPRGRGREGRRGGTVALAAEGHRRGVSGYA